MNSNYQYDIITESETLDSWEDEVATTPEDEVDYIYLLFIHLCDFSKRLQKRFQYIHIFHFTMTNSVNGEWIISKKDSKCHS